MDIHILRAPIGDSFPKSSDDKFPTHPKKADVKFRAISRDFQTPTFAGCTIRICYTS